MKDVDRSIVPGSRFPVPGRLPLSRNERQPSLENCPVVSKSRRLQSLLAGIAFLGYLFSANIAHACVLPFGASPASGNWNAMELQYDPANDDYVVIDTWYDSSLESYQPGSDDFVVPTADGGIDVIFIELPAGGGGGGGGGGDLPPPVIQGSAVKDHSRDGSIIQCAPADNGDLDRVTSIGRAVGLALGWLRVQAVRRFGGGGGGGGGGGSSSSRAPGTPIDHEPQHPAECSDGEQARMDHAIGSFGLEQSQRLASGQPILRSQDLVSIGYSGGGSESYQVISPFASYPLLRIDGSLVCP